MASNTADVVSSITVDGESTNHVELDWGDSVRLNISVPTDPAYAILFPISFLQIFRIWKIPTLLLLAWIPMATS